MSKYRFSQIELPDLGIRFITEAAIHIEDGEAQDPQGTPVEQWAGKWILTLTISAAQGERLSEAFLEGEETVVADVRLKQPIESDYPSRASGKVSLDSIDEERGIAGFIGSGPLMLVSKTGG